MNLSYVRVGEPEVMRWFCPTCQVSSLETAAVDLIDAETFEMVMGLSVTVCSNECGYYASAPRKKEVVQ